MLLNFTNKLELCKKFLNNLLDYIFYRKCYFCGSITENGLMCGKCFDNIKSAGFRKRKLIKGIEIQGYFFYQQEIKKLIRAVKYHNKKELAEQTAKILLELMEKENFCKEDFEIVPVPLHPERQKKRNYNHMQLISEEFSKFTGCKINTNIIKRIKNTQPQYKLSLIERRKNLCEAFEVFPKEYTGKKLLLFDDLCTTGATMEELINELRKNNIYNVSGLVISFAG